jgi:hypothetical protein
VRAAEEPDATPAGKRQRRRSSQRISTISATTSVAFQSAQAKAETTKAALRSAQEAGRTQILRGATKYQIGTALSARKLSRAKDVARRGDEIYSTEKA